MKGLTPEELIAWTPPYQKTIIGSNILIAQGSMMVYGKEETWKSMLVGLDMSFKIANGLDWFGYPTIPSSVYNFQTEIPQSPLRDRVIKYMTGNHVTSKNIWFSSELYMKVDKGWGYAELEKELTRTKPKVLVIDNISSSVSGKLVDDYEMGLFLDRMDMLRDKFKLAVVIIHHTRIPEHSQGETFHYGTDEAFGSSRFPRWFDTIIYVAKVNDNDAGLVSLDLTFEKTRFAEERLKPLHLTVRRSDLVFSKDGNS